MSWMQQVCHGAAVAILAAQVTCMMPGVLTVILAAAVAVGASVVALWLIQEWVVHKWLLHSSFDWAGGCVGQEGLVSWCCCALLQPHQRQHFMCIPFCSAMQLPRHCSSHKESKIAACFLECTVNWWRHRVCAGKTIHKEHHEQPYHHVSLDPPALVISVMLLAAAVFAVLLGPSSPLWLTATAAYWSAGES